MLERFGEMIKPPQSTSSTPSVSAAGLAACTGMSPTAPTHIGPVLTTRELVPFTVRPRRWRPSSAFFTAATSTHHAQHEQQQQPPSGFSSRVEGIAAHPSLMEQQQLQQQQQQQSEQQQHHPHAHDSLLLYRQSCTASNFGARSTGIRGESGPLAARPPGRPNGAKEGGDSSGDINLLGVEFEGRDYDSYVTSGVRGARSASTLPSEVVNDENNRRCNSGSRTSPEAARADNPLCSVENPIQSDKLSSVAESSLTGACLPNVAAAGSNSGDRCLEQTNNVGVQALSGIADALNTGNFEGVQGCLRTTSADAGSNRGRNLTNTGAAFPSNCDTNGSDFCRSPEVYRRAGSRSNSSGRSGKCSHTPDVTTLLGGGDCSSDLRRLCTTDPTRNNGHASEGRGSDDQQQQQCVDGEKEGRGNGEKEGNSGTTVSSDNTFGRAGYMEFITGSESGSTAAGFSERTDAWLNYSQEVQRNQQQGQAEEKHNEKEAGNSALRPEGSTATAATGGQHYFSVHGKCSDRYLFHSHSTVESRGPATRPSASSPPPTPKGTNSEELDRWCREKIAGTSCVFGDQVINNSNGKEFRVCSGDDTSEFNDRDCGRILPGGISVYSDITSNKEVVRLDYVYSENRHVVRQGLESRLQRSEMEVEKFEIAEMFGFDSLETESSRPFTTNRNQCTSAEPNLQQQIELISQGDVRGDRGGDLLAEFGNRSTRSESRETLTTKLPSTVRQESSTLSIHELRPQHRRRNSIGDVSGIYTNVADGSDSFRHGTANVSSGYFGSVELDGVEEPVTKRSRPSDDEVDVIFGRGGFSSSGIPSTSGAVLAVLRELNEVTGAITDTTGLSQLETSSGRSTDELSGSNGLNEKRKEKPRVDSTDDVIPSSRPPRSPLTPFSTPSSLSDSEISFRTTPTNPAHNDCRGVASELALSSLASMEEQMEHQALLHQEEHKLQFCQLKEFELLPDRVRTSEEGQQHYDKIGRRSVCHRTATGSRSYVRALPNTSSDVDHNVVKIGQPGGTASSPQLNVSLAGSVSETTDCNHFQSIMTHQPTLQGQSANCEIGAAMIPTSRSFGFEGHSAKKSKEGSRTKSCGSDDGVQIQEQVTVMVPGSHSPLYPSENDTTAGSIKTVAAGDLARDLVVLPDATVASLAQPLTFGASPQETSCLSLHGSQSSSQQQEQLPPESAQEPFKLGHQCSIACKNTCLNEFAEALKQANSLMHQYHISPSSKSHSELESCLRPSPGCSDSVEAPAGAPAASLGKMVCTSAAPVPRMSGRRSQSPTVGNYLDSHSALEIYRTAMPPSSTGMAGSITTPADSNLVERSTMTPHLFELADLGQLGENNSTTTTTNDTRSGRFSVLSNMVPSENLSTASNRLGCVGDPSASVCMGGVLNSTLHMLPGSVPTGSPRSGSLEAQAGAKRASLSTTSEHPPELLPPGKSLPVGEDGGIEQQLTHSPSQQQSSVTHSSGVVLVNRSPVLSPPDPLGHHHLASGDGTASMAGQSLDFCESQGGQSLDLALVSRPSRSRDAVEHFPSHFSAVPMSATGDSAVLTGSPMGAISLEEIIGGGSPGTAAVPHSRHGHHFQHCQQHHLPHNHHQQQQQHQGINASSNNGEGSIRNNCQNATRQQHLCQHVPAATQQEKNQATGESGSSGLHPEVDKPNLPHAASCTSRHGQTQPQEHQKLCSLHEQQQAHKLLLVLNTGSTARGVSGSCSTSAKDTGNGHNVPPRGLMPFSAMGAFGDLGDLHQLCGESTGQDRDSSPPADSSGRSHSSAQSSAPSSFEGILLQPTACGSTINRNHLMSVDSIPQQQQQQPSESFAEPHHQGHSLALVQQAAAAFGGSTAQQQQQQLSRSSDQLGPHAQLAGYDIFRCNSPALLQGGPIPQMFHTGSSASVLNSAALLSSTTSGDSPTAHLQQQQHHHQQQHHFHHHQHHLQPASGRNLQSAGGPLSLDHDLHQLSGMPAMPPLLSSPPVSGPVGGHSGLEAEVGSSGAGLTGIVPDAQGVSGPLCYENSSSGDISAGLNSGIDSLNAEYRRLLRCIPRKSREAFSPSDLAAFRTCHPHYSRNCFILMQNGYDIRLGEVGRAALKKEISKRLKGDAELRERCVSVVCRLKNANVLQLLQMAEISGCLALGLKISSCYWKEYAKKQRSGTSNFSGSRRERSLGGNNCGYSSSTNRNRSQAGGALFTAADNLAMPSPTLGTEQQIPWQRCVTGRGNSLPFGDTPPGANNNIDTCCSPLLLPTNVSQPLQGSAAMTSQLSSDGGSSTPPTGAGVGTAPYPPFDNLQWTQQHYENSAIISDVKLPNCELNSIGTGNLFANSSGYPFGVNIPNLMMQYLPTIAD